MERGLSGNVHEQEGQDHEPPVSHHGWYLRTPWSHDRVGRGDPPRQRGLGPGLAVSREPSSEGRIAARSDGAAECGAAIATLM